MGDLSESRAAQRAAIRLLAADSSIYAAFDGLACGIGHEEAVEYLMGSPSISALPEGERAKAVGAVLGFAIVAVESERCLRFMGRRQT